MLLLLPSIITLFLALITGYLAFRMKHPLGIIIMLFIYTTFHYTYSALTIFYVRDETQYIRNYTQQGVKIIGFAFIFYIIGLAVWRYRQDLFSITATKTVRWFWGLFLIWIAAVLCFWGINIINKGIFPGGLAKQGLISVFLLGISVWIFGSILKANSKFDTKILIKYEKFYQSLLIFTILMLIVSIIQIVTERTFAGTNLPTGEYVHRACGLMYNPNVLGFWACLSAIIGAYGYHTSKNRKIVPILIMVLSCACILISGSRSGVIICLITISGIPITLLFLKKIDIKNIFMPFIIIVSSILLIISSVMFSDKVTGGSNKGIHNLNLIAYRFAKTPVEVIAYINNLIISGDKNKIMPEPETDSKHLDNSTTLSIKGRITASRGIPTDNAYIAMYEEFGSASLIAWFLWGTWLLALSIKAHIKVKSIKSAYGINLILACFISGIFMRSFQVFPFWVFNAILLSISFSIILIAGKSHRL